MATSEFDSLGNSADKWVVVGLQGKSCKVTLRITITVNANEVSGYAAITSHLNDSLSYLATLKIWKIIEGQ